MPAAMSFSVFSRASLCVFVCTYACASHVLRISAILEPLSKPETPPVAIPSNADLADEMLHAAEAPRTDVEQYDEKEDIKDDMIDEQRKNIKAMQKKKPPPKPKRPLLKERNFYVGLDKDGKSIPKAGDSKDSKTKKKE
eukprot:GHVU01084456.1.p1 GENE.GHVU01084456.1~~GHVU01084456.1.p1  ORF type:complete len:139 (-),score=26.21 GHVU01084456.1:1684-2100(-)